MVSLPRRRRQPPRKRAPRRLVRKPRRKGVAIAERASCKEIYTINNMVSNAPFADTEQNLGDYTRATSIAKNYQFFRIKYIKYKFLCRYNTYQATTAEATAFPMPYFHFMIDKAGALSTNTGLAQLKAEGAVPIKFTKDLTVSWRPGVSFATANDNNAATLSTAYKVSPWLMTNKAPESTGWTVNDTDHKGLYWYMETAGLPGDGTYEYDAEVEVMFEFKKPLLPAAAGQPAAIKAQAWQAQQILSGKTPEQNTTIPA